MLVHVTAICGTDFTVNPEHVVYFRKHQNQRFVAIRLVTGEELVVDSTDAGLGRLIELSERHKPAAKKGCT